MKPSCQIIDGLELRSHYWGTRCAQIAHRIPAADLCKSLQPVQSQPSPTRLMKWIAKAASAVLTGWLVPRVLGRVGMNNFTFPTKQEISHWTRRTGPEAPTHNLHPAAKCTFQRESCMGTGTYRDRTCTGATSQSPS